jgi:hypothetical protein
MELDVHDDVGNSSLWLMDKIPSCEPKIALQFDGPQAADALRDLISSFHSLRDSAMLCP